MGAARETESGKKFKHFEQANEWLRKRERTREEDETFSP